MIPSRFRLIIEYRTVNVILVVPQPMCNKTLPSRFLERGDLLNRRFAKDNCDIISLRNLVHIAGLYADKIPESKVFINNVLNGCSRVCKKTNGRRIWEFNFEGGFDIRMAVIFGAVYRFV